MSEALLCPVCSGAVPEDAPAGLCPRCLFQCGLSNETPTSSYDTWTPPTPEELAPHFPQLEILALLGQGGMGAVYKARQVKLDRLVALKILPTPAGRDPAFAERFAREARALAKLNHPHIVGIHDFGEAGGYFFFLMEHVDGFNLRQWIRAGQLQRPGTLEIVPQVCDALQYAHEQGIVHRDIKPENILLTRAGQVKIADFGLAKLMGPSTKEARLTATHQVMGTPHYMAPEQLERPLTVDRRADIYSLGVVCYEMITGELPLGRFAPPSHKAPVDPRLDAIVLRMLENAPEQRYQHISEVVPDLQRLGRPAPQAPALVKGINVEEEIELETVKLYLSRAAGGLMLAGILSFVSWALILLSDRSLNTPLAWWLVALGGLFILYGGTEMGELRRPDLVSMAAWAAVIPWSPAWIIAFPIGVWVLGVLDEPEVKRAFLRKAVNKRFRELRLPPPGRLGPDPLPTSIADTPPPAKTTGFLRRKLRSLAGNAYSLLFKSRPK
jgi:serine/threonine protein kinase